MSLRTKNMALVVALCLFAAAPHVGVYPIFALKLLCFALFAASFNLLIGYTGLLSFGHAAFFGGAAYATGYAMKAWQLPTELGIAFGVAAGTLLGAVVGALAIRRKGIYFAMVTLALAQMFYFVYLQAPFTGGEDGLQGVPRGRLLGLLDMRPDVAAYYAVGAIVLAAFWLIARIVDSPFGRLLVAVRENEPRAVSLGYDVDRLKLLAFVLSAALAGLAGSLKTVVLGFATLTDVAWMMSGSVVLMTLVGGMGTLAGPFVGAFVVVLLENRLGEAGDWLAGATGARAFAEIGQSITTVIGLVFILCVMLFRRGLVGELARLLPERTSRTSLPGPAGPGASVPEHR